MGHKGKKTLTIKKEARKRDWRIRCDEVDECGKGITFLDYNIVYGENGHERYKSRRLYSNGDYCEYPYCDLSLPQPKFGGVRILHQDL